MSSMLRRHELHSGLRNTACEQPAARAGVAGSLGLSCQVGLSADAASRGHALLPGQRAARGGPCGTR